MTRRITAMLLILAVLLSVVPVMAIADEDYVYQIGDDIWVTGNSDDAPTAPTVEGGCWDKVIGPDGRHETKPSCDLEIHEKHSTATGCFDSVIGLICTKPIHTAKTHAIVCSFMAPKYHWVVITAPEDVPTVPPGEGDEGEGDGLESDGSGVNDPLGQIYFTVTNLDTNGAPVAGSKFGLFAWDGENYAFLENQNAKEELQKRIEEQKLEQQEMIEQLQAEGDAEALDAYIQEANRQNQQIIEAMNDQSDSLLAKTTGTDGKVYFRSLEKYLSETHKETDGTTETWRFHLVQADRDITYKANNDPVEVKIQKTGDSYSLYLNDQLYTESDEAAGGYVFVNEIEQFRFFVYMQCFDEDGTQLAGEALDNVTASVQLINTENSDKNVTVNFPPENVIVEAQKWKQTVQVAPGTYTAGDLQIGGSIEGYTFKSSSWTFELPEGALSGGLSADQVTLEKLTGATLAIKAYYEKTGDSGQEPNPETPTNPSTDPSAPTKYTLKPMAVESGTNKQLSGAVFTLTSVKNGLIDDAIRGVTKDGAGNYVLDVQLCEAGDYKLTEREVPAGFDVDDNEYTIQVSANGDVKLVEDEGFRSLFSKTNLTKTGESTKEVKFWHTRRMARLSVEIDVNVDVKPSKLFWAYKESEAIGNDTYVFVLKTKDAQGKAVSEELVIENGETKAKWFKTEIPFETSYTVELKNPESVSFNCKLKDAKGKTSNKVSGKVTAEDTQKNISLTAEIDYEIISGDDDLDLYFIKVDSRTKKGLADAKFTLSDGNGQEMMRYATIKGGIMDVENLILQPGRYELKEVKAPEDYDLPRKPIDILVTVSYEPETRNGRTVLVQCLREDEDGLLSNKSVEKGKNGTYLIKNTASGDNPKTGDGFDLRLWTGVLMLSMAGVTALAVDQKKKRAGK